MENETILTSVRVITALTELLNSTFFATLFGFILGLASQLILSKWQKRTKEKKDKEEFDIFEKMISDGYVTPFHNILEEYSEVSGYNKYSELRGYAKSAQTRLNFLKEQEVIFLKSDNQFKMVRLIEFTKTYFKEAGGILSFYTFKPLDASAKDYEKDKKIQEANIKVLKASYEKNKKSYVELKTDILFLQKDLFFLE